MKSGMERGVVASYDRLAELLVSTLARSAAEAIKRYASIARDNPPTAERVRPIRCTSSGSLLNR